MSHRLTHISTLPAKRRRVLSDIINTNSTTSLGFDMVTIDHFSGSENSRRKRKSELAIPVPPPNKAHEINELASKNKENSRIPTKVPTKVDNYITMNRNLAEKSRVRMPSFEELCKRDWLRESARADQEVQSLREKLKLVDQELHQAAAELHGVLDENEAAQDLNRQLRRRQSELRERNRVAKNQFDAMEAEVKTKVAHAEKMMHLDLREVEMKLQDEYNESKFQLEQQVKESAEFQDGELVAEHSRLLLKKLELEQNVQHTINTKNTTLAAELAQLEAALEKTLQEKRHEVEKAAALYHQKQERFEEIMKDYELLSSQVDERNKTAGELSIQIEQLKENILAHECQRLEKEAELHRLNDLVRSMQGDDLDWQAKVDEEKQKYELANLKLEKYLTTRRILEHAIMNFSVRTRIYVRLESKETFSNNQITTSSAVYKFDKLSRLSLKSDYSQEWKLLVGEVMTKNDVSIIFSGDVLRSSTYQLVEAFDHMTSSESALKAKGWLATYNLQSILVNANGATDLLNKHTEPVLDFQNGHFSLSSQQMRVLRSSDLTTAVKDVEMNQGGVCHLLEAEATNSKTGKTCNHRLVILNISHLDVEKQTRLFGGVEVGLLQSILGAITNGCKALNVCDLVEVNDRTEPLLKAIKAPN